MHWIHAGVVFASLLTSFHVGTPPTPIPYTSDAKTDAPKSPAIKLASPIVPGGFADLSVDTPAGTSVIWRISPPPVQRANGLPAGRCIFGGLPNTTYTVTVLVIDFKAQTVTDSEQTVTFGGQAPPPVPVPPPVPTDPLLVAVQAAYDADTSPTKATDKTALAAVYLAMADAVPSIGTAGGLLQVLTQSRKARIGEGLAGTRKVLNAKLQELFPKDKTLTDADKKAAADQFKVFAATLQGVK